MADRTITQDEYREVAQNLISVRMETGAERPTELAGKIYREHGPFELETYYLELDWYYGSEGDPLAGEKSTSASGDGIDSDPLTHLKNAMVVCDEGDMEMIRRAYDDVLGRRRGSDTLSNEEGTPCIRCDKPVAADHPQPANDRDYTVLSTGQDAERVAICDECSDLVSGRNL